MKKCLLLCLLAGSTLLASMQTYAVACSIKYPPDSPEWRHCTIDCALTFGPIGIPSCL